MGDGERSGVSDETLIDRVTRRVERRIEGYEGPERRGKAPYSPLEALKWLPLVLACLTGYGGYIKTQADVDTLKRDLAKLEAHVGKLEDDNDEVHVALWRRIRE